MHIANPIYDVAFKYLLEDKRVAKLFLSAIIGETITELDFSAQENVVNVDVKDTETKKAIEPVGSDTIEKIILTVCRFDFSAKIKTKTGFKTVGIELQKSKLLSDIERFRKYLSVRYASQDNTYLVTKKKMKRKDENHDEPETQTKSRQIYCIYILDYGMDLPPIPVLKVSYIAEDVFSGDEYPAKGEFLEGLHHLSWIIQIPQLKEKRRNKLEKLLSVFDQSAVTDNRCILNIDDTDFPEEYRDIVRRLIKAKEDPKTMRKMELEDDTLNDIRKIERAMAKAKAETEKAKAKAKKAEDKAVKAEEKAKNAEEKAKAAKTEVAFEVALKLLEKGMPKDEVAEMTNLSVEEINKLIK